MMRRFRAGLLLAFPSCVSGHTGEALRPHDLWTTWPVDPGVVIPMLLAGFLYARGRPLARGTSGWQDGCFWGGMATLAAALLSPLHPLGEVLFSAHMVQHEILMLIAAPLLVLSRPLVPMLWGLPFEWRRAAGRWSRTWPVRNTWQGLTHPAAAWSIHGAAIWMWHAPPLFDATLTHEWIHAAQHVSFFGSALLFWWSLLHARGASVLYLFTTAVHTSILGALLTFGQTVWYPAYNATAAQWGLSPLEDQQLGGLIMWIPGGLVYLAAALALLAGSLRESEIMAQRRRYAD